MAFDYEIVAHGDKAHAVNEAIRTDLVNVEKQNDRVRDAMGRWTSSDALKNKQGEFVGTAVASQRMRENVDALTSAWEREDNVLERIKGPTREYEADLRALVSLQQQGAITSKEYGEELEKMNRKKRGGDEGGGIKVEGSIGKAFASQAGEVGNIASSLASGAAIEATALAAVAVEAVRLGDDYIQLSNKAQRLAGADGDVSKTIDEQLGLSKQLHGSLEQTMELSTTVRERTESLNLTQRQQTALTRELAEAVQLSGHSMADASGVINGLAFALDEGVPAGKQLKQVMKEFPEVAKVMEEQTGKTAKQLIEMGNKGQFSMATLVDAFSAADGELGDKFGHRVETLGQQWQHFKDDVTVSIGRFVESTGIIKKLGDALHFVGEVIGIIVKPFAMLRDALGYLEDKFGTVGTVIKNFALGPLTLIGKSFGIIGDLLSGTSDRFDIFTPKTHDASEAFKMFQDAANGVTPPVKTVGQAFDALLLKLEKINREAAESGHQLRDTIGDAATSLSTKFVQLNDELRKLGLLTDSWSTTVKGGAGMAMEHAAAVGEAKRQLAALNDQMKFGGIGAEEYKQKYRSLLDTIEGGRSALRTIFYGINDPLEAFDRNLVATRALFDAGRISVMEYGNEIEKLEKSDPYFAQLEQQLKRDVAEYDRLAAADKMYREMREHGITATFRNPNESDLARVAVKAPADDSITKQAEAAMDAHEKRANAELELAAAKREDAAETSRVNEQEKKNLALVDLRIELLKKLATPAEKVREDINQINKAFAEGSGGSAADYDRLLADLKAKYFDVAPEEKYAKALKNIDEVGAMLHATTDELARAHLKLKQEFDQPLTIGEGVDSALMKVKKEMQDVGTVAQVAIVNAFHSIENALVDLVTKGTTDWSKMVQSMESDLARLAIRELEMKLVGSLFGGADLPAHDMGAQWVVPGSGGADTSLQAFWASPGETVTVSPSGGSSSARMSGGAGGGPMSMHLHLIDDPRALPVAMMSGAGQRATTANIARSPAAIRRILR